MILLAVSPVKNGQNRRIKMPPYIPVISRISIKAKIALQIEKVVLVPFSLRT